MKSLLNVTLLLSTAAASANPATSQPHSWVALTAQPSAQQYVIGTPIPITLTAKNISPGNAFLHFASGQRFDVQLFKVGVQTPVYTWSATRLFPMMVGQLRLGPGQSTSFSAQVGDEQGALVPGAYELRAFLSNSSKIEAAPVKIEVVPTPMQFKISTDKNQYKLGEPVSFSLLLTNTSKTSQEIQFSSGQRFDIVVSDEAGHPVWNWAANKRFTRSLRRETLAPGESRTFQANWDGQALPDGKIGPGTYSIQGVLWNTPHVNAAPVTIEVK